MRKIMIVEDDPAIREELASCWRMRAIRLWR